MKMCMCLLQKSKRIKRYMMLPKTINIELRKLFSAKKQKTSTMIRISSIFKCSQISIHFKWAKGRKAFSFRNVIWKSNF